MRPLGLPALGLPALGLLALGLLALGLPDEEAARRGRAADGFRPRPPP
jgi:hypothetical protein